MLGIYCVSINPPGDLDLWPLNPKTVPLLEYPKIIPYTKFEHFGIIRFWVMLRTNRQTNRLTRIFRMGRPTKFKLGTQTEHEDPYQRQAPWSPRSKVKVAKSCDASDRCWPISRERNVLETPKLVGRLPTPQATIPTKSKVKDLCHMVNNTTQ